MSLQQTSLPSDSLQRDIDAFLDYLKFEKNSSRHTLAAYCRDLKKLSGWLASQNISTWSELSEKRLRLWLAELHGNGLQSKSLQRLLSSVRSLFRYLNRQGIVEDNPAKRLSAPKTQENCPLRSIPTRWMRC